MKLQEEIRQHIMLEMLVGNTRAIEETERWGQQKFSEMRSILPKHDNVHTDGDVLDFYENHGIKVIGDYDDYFLEVEIPNSIKIEPQPHAMYCYLIEDKKKIAEIFFKASAYDYHAFIRYRDGDNLSED